MKLKYCTLAVALAATLALSACKDKEAQVEQGATAAIAATAESPHAAIEAVAQSLRAGNLKAILEATVPPARMVQVRGEWLEEMKSKPITDEDRTKFAEQMDKLTAADAEEKMWAELEPTFNEKKAEVQMQMPMMIGFGRGMLASTIEQNAELSAQQKAQSVAALDAFVGWAQNANFMDADLAKKSIGIVCATARELDVKTLDALHALDFDQALAKGDIAFTGLKKLLDVYGLSMNQTFESVKAETVTQKGDDAKVKVNFNLLGKPLDYEADMVHYEGRWYGKEILSELQKNAQGGEVADGAESNG